MRPKLSEDTFWSHNAAGVYFRNNQGAAVLEGAAASELFRRLSPFLTGSRTIEQLCKDTSPQKRRAIEEILTWLEARRFVRDQSTSTDACSTTHRFLDYFVVDSDAALAKFSRAELLIVAEREVTDGLVDVLAQLGNARARAVSPTAFRIDDVDRADGVLLFAEDDREPILDAVGNACWSRAKPFFPSFRLGSHLFFGPVVERGRAGCWRCMTMRARENLLRQDGARAHALDRPYVASLLSLEVLKHFGGAPLGEMSGTVVTFDPASLSSARHPLIAHDRCPVCAPTRLGNEALAVVAAVPDIAPRASSAVDDPALLDEIRPMTDERLGVVRRLHESSFQLPLVRSAAELAQPAWDERKLPITTLSSGLDYQESRRRAVAAGLAEYVRRRAPRTGVVRGRYADLLRDSFAVIAPDLVWQGASIDDDHDWTWGVRVPAMRLALVPIAAASIIDASLPTDAFGFGSTQRAMLEHAFVRAAVIDAESMAAHGLARWPVDVTEACGPRGRRFAKALAQFGIRPNVYTVDHFTGVPIAVAIGGDGDAVFAAGATHEAAVDDCLRRFLARVQADAHDEPWDTGFRRVKVPDAIERSESGARERAARERSRRAWSLDDTLERWAGRDAGVLVPLPPLRLREKTFRVGRFIFARSAEGGEA